VELIQIASFILVATLLVISPGPNGLLIARTVPLSGRNAGFANIAGFVAAFFVHGSLSILGLSVILVQSADAFFAVKILGALYLCWVGIKSLVAAWKSKQPVATAELNRKLVSLRSAFFEGFLTNALNPKVSMFYLAAFPQFMPVGGTATSAFVLVLLHALINCLWFGSIVILMSRMKSWAVTAAVSRWLKAVTGLVFIGFGVKLALLKPMQHS